LQYLRENDDKKGLMHLLRQDLVKDICGITCSELYKVCRNGTKIAIESYHNEVIKSI
jgi:hypothetical protein